MTTNSLYILSKYVLRSNEHETVFQRPLSDRVFQAFVFLLFGTFWVLPIISIFHEHAANDPVLFRSWLLLLTLVFGPATVSGFCHLWPWRMCIEWKQGTYRVQRGIWPFTVVERGSLGELQETLIRQGRIKGEGHTYHIFIRRKKQRWGTCIGRSSDRHEAEELARGIAAKIGVPYRGVRSPERGRLG